MVKYHSTQWMVFLFGVTFGIADILGLIALLGFIPLEWAVLWLVGSTPIAMLPVLFDLYGGFERLET